MTYLEKLRQEHPEFLGGKYPGGVAICPEDVGYEATTPCRAMQPGEAYDPSVCMECWNREAPDNG